MSNGFTRRAAGSWMDALGRSLVFLPLCLSVCAGYLIIIPENKVAMLGESLQLDCTTNETISSLSWYDFTSGIREVSMNSANFFPNLFTISGTPPAYNLQINKLKMSSGGRYACTYGQHYSNAEVVVLEDEPFCWTNVSSDGVSVEGETLEITCSLSYSSSPSWVPAMYWSGPTALRLIGNASETLARGPRSLATFNSSVLVEVIPELDGAMVNCLTDFPLPSDVGVGYATNIPAFSHSWYSLPLNVQFPPKDVTVCPDERAYLPYTTITCFVISKPLSTYYWVNLDTNQTVDGPSFQVPGYEEEGKNLYRYQCVATNLIKQVKHTGKSDILTIKVVTDDKPRDLRILILSGVLAIALIALILIVAAFIGYCRRMRKRSFSPQVYQY